LHTPLSWLKSFTPLAADATDRDSVQELAAELDALGLVVEGMEFVGQGLDDVIVSQVLEITAIKGADRIRRVVVDVGGGETTEVVCGAWNFEVGDVIPFIGAGHELPGGVRIERRTMRGVTSNGMLCSPRELGLADDHAGLMVLERPGTGSDSGPSSTTTELGMPLKDYLGIGPDVVFDLAIEANRPDCLSMAGVARDLAAHYGLPFEIPEPSLAGSAPAAGDLASVKVESPELCLRLTARVLTGVRIVPSPQLVQRRLSLAGMRPINCAVDASNYVMLELGQPTHPYDLDLLGGRGLVARSAHPGESIVTLDGETRILGTRPARGSDQISALDCLICNANDLPVGIGGVMGGQSSEISEATTSVLLEAAVFLPVAVGRTARWLGLRSEASARFERGVDRGGVERASLRVCQLIAEAAEAAGAPPPALASGLLDDDPRPYEPSKVRARPGRINALLGTALAPQQMITLLEPIGFEASSEVGADGDGEGAGAGDGGGAGAGDGGGADRGDGAPVLELVVPSWRPDVTAEVDVVEEVARTYGYRKIPRTDRRSPFVGRLDEVQALRRRARRVMAGLGAHEAWTSSIVDPAEQARAGLTDALLVRISNPMVAEESVLRAGLLAGLLAALRHNSGHRHPWLRLFEMGDVFSMRARPADGAAEGEVFPDERERMALLLAREGDDAGAAVNAWRVLSDSLGIVGVEIAQEPAGSDGGGTLAGLHLSRSARLVVAGDETPPPATGSVPSSAGEADPGTLIGTIGEVDPEVLRAFGLPHERVGWLEVNLNRLVGAPRRPLLARPISRYPSSDVDLAFILEDTVPAQALEETLRQAATELCESVELFDIYRGEGVPDGSRSLAYRLRFCALDHTLTDGEVAELRQRCIDAVVEALPASLRA
jgi:phenylalanyl-tRNA synthetase beta chain